MNKGQNNAFSSRLIESGALFALRGPLTQFGSSKNELCLSRDEGQSLALFAVCVSLFFSSSSLSVCLFVSFSFSCGQVCLAPN